MPITKEFLLATRDTVKAEQAKFIQRAQAEIAAYNGAIAVYERQIAQLEAEEETMNAGLEAEIVVEDPDGDLPPDDVLKQAREWLETEKPDPKEATDAA